MSKNKSPRFQAKAMLKPLLRLGESRNEAKKEAIRDAEAKAGKKSVYRRSSLRASIPHRHTRTMLMRQRSSENGQRQSTVKRN